MAVSALFVRLALVAVGATNIALRNLVHQPRDAYVPANYSTDFKAFLATVIELKHDRVGLATIQARVGD